MEDRVFGPRPRNYGFKLNKSLKKLARKSALSQKAKNNEVLVVENLEFDSAKTKNFISLLQGLGIEGKKSLFVLSESNNNVYLSSRNLKAAEVVTASELNTYKILHSNNIVFVEGSLEGVESNLSK